MSSVALVRHDPSWATRASDVGSALSATIGACVTQIHHVGSTAITGIRAKPVLDLIPVVTSLAALEARRGALAAAGWEWRGEFGLTDRRFLVLNDRATGERLVNAHCYVVGSPEITRHLAFRDYLLENPDLARDYEAVKIGCAAQHPDDMGAYCDCKDNWIKRMETEALAALTLHRIPEAATGCVDPMRRILITGCAGSGKSTLATALSRELRLPVVHLDRHYWRPGWEMPDSSAWADDVAQIARQPSWIMDGNYLKTLAGRLAFADAVIHLDLPTHVCLYRVIRRTALWLGRKRDDMADGCRERWDGAFLSYVLHYRRDHRPRMMAALGAYPKPVVTLKTPGEVRALLSRVSATGRIVA